MGDMDPLRSLAAALAPDSKVSAQVVKGVVTALDPAGSPPTLSLQLGGDTSSSIAGVRFMDSYWPVIGDTVEVIKQGSTIIVIGQVADASSHAENGWVTPSLASGWSAYSNDPLMWRLVYDHGSKKVQLRGRVTLSSGTPSTIWTMPTECRPLFQLAPILVARGWGGGSVVAQIDVTSGGNINLTGATVGVKASSGQQTGIGGGSAVTGPSSSSNTGNNGYQSSSTSGAQDNLNLTNGNTAAAHIHFDGQHTHPMSHTHLGGAHQHPLDAVTFPDFVSFNGVEYFI